LIELEHGWVDLEGQIHLCRVVRSRTTRLQAARLFDIRLHNGGLNHSLRKMSFPRWQRFAFCGSGWKWLVWKLLRIKNEFLRLAITKIVLGKVSKSCQRIGKRGEISEADARSAAEARLKA
jgi:hypothetical protein